MKKPVCLLTLALLLSLSASAAGVPAGWVKVDAKNKSKCVDHAIINNQSYCSLKPLTIPDKKPKAKNERAKLQFDKRAWVPDWEKSDANGGYMVKYVPPGQTLKNWQELVTSQYYPDIQATLSPKQFMDAMVNVLKQKNYKPVVAVLSDKPGDLVFEVRITEPADKTRHEIQRIVAGKKGMFVIHYAMKKPDMGKFLRAQWQGFLQAATFTEEPAQPTKSLKIQ